MIEQINPMIRLDYPDPDVIRVEDTYYMVTTTMHFMPGCEILRSYDLVHWEHASYVYDRLDSTSGQRLEGDANIYGKGMWAASLRYHRGVFYICFAANDTGKTYLYQAGDIHGPWKKQYVEGFYHDASLLFDEERVYLASGNKEIRVIELNEDLSGPKEGGFDRIVVRDEGNAILGYEGTHFYKINGRYYLFFIHSLKERWRRVEACFMAETLEGEFTGGDILNDDRGYYDSGVAQGGIVDTPDGEWYAILFQDYGAAGRIPVLVPVDFREKYPVFGKAGKIPDIFALPKGRADYGYRPLADCDDFRKREAITDASEGRETVSEAYDTYGFKSCWQINHEPVLSLIHNDCERGILEITTGKLCKSMVQAQNIFTQRMRFPTCSGSVTVDGSKFMEGDYAGISVFAGCYGMAALTKREGKYYVVMREKCQEEGLDGEVERVCIPVGESTVRFMVSADFVRMKDKARFYYKNGEEYVRIGPEKKLYFQLDHFSGCRLGLFIYASKRQGGTARFSDFVYINGIENL
ncbi:MAG: glycoside hydrolase 43 family protein [Lachnospiraceae bacterium]|nr:glycoside hydrolase 43 family protein [Lachnospiraceae bacterium]